jgi:hypothetical protein
MMMTLVHALLQPNYSLSNINQYSNITKTKPYSHYDIGYDDLKTEIISFDNNSIKDIHEENINAQIDVDVPNGQLSTTNTLNNNNIGFKMHKIFIRSRKIAIKNAYKFLTNKQKLYHKKQNKAHVMNKRNKRNGRNGIKYNLTITFDKHLVHKVYNINYNNRILSHLIYKINNNRTNNCLSNMNIKHLKLFKLLNNLKTNHSYVYLYKQLIIIDNLNKNIHINDNIYVRYKTINYISFNMPNIEEVTEIYIKLPADLYNILALKAVNMTFNDNGWHRLEQLLNILCNTINGNLNGFDIVWWNMQTCWTSFRKNSNAKWTKEFTVNCEVITDDEKEIMTVYTIMDGKNVPINVEMRPTQVLIDLISNI